MILLILDLVFSASACFEAGIFSLSNFLEKSADSNIYSPKREKVQQRLAELKAWRSSGTEVFQRYCLQTPAHALRHKDDLSVRGCFGIHNGYIFIVDVLGNEWVGVASAKVLLMLAWMHYEHRSIEVPLVGKGFKKTGRARMIEGVDVEVYPEWLFHKLSDLGANVRTQWLNLYCYFQQQESQGSWYGNYTYYYRPASMDSAKLLNEQVYEMEAYLLAEQQVEIFRRKIEIALPEIKRRKYDVSELDEWFVRIEREENGIKDGGTVYKSFNELTRK